MRVKFASTYDKEFKVFSITPAFVLGKSIPPEPEEPFFIIHWLFWMIAFIPSPPPKKKYATCIQPIPRLMTRGKEYDKIKSETYLPYP
jgi:hypothetical protein